MPPSSRIVPRSDSWLSLIAATVSFRSWKTRWLSCSSDSPAGVMRMRRPTRRNTGSFELVFEQQNLAADRRLRDVQLLAGGGERTGFGDGADDFELSKVHEALPECMGAYISWRDGFKANYSIQL